MLLQVYQSIVPLAGLYEQNVLKEYLKAMLPFKKHGKSAFKKLG